MKKWEEAEIVTDNGTKELAQFPIIISASRATDIPKYFSEWFFNRLKEGYAKWYNPYNRRYSYYSFEKTRLIVFWSKDPSPMIDKLEEIDKRNINYYFQFTLNDYDIEGYEKNIPPLKKRIVTFKKLSKLIGKEKVIWRFDPLMLTDKVNIESLFKKVKNIQELELAIKNAIRN